MVITGFHSVGSRSERLEWVVGGILEEGGLLWTRVGVIGATIVRGERGGDAGGVYEVEAEGIEAERGLQESLRRQLEGVSIVL